ncbi:mannose-6-phosphate isomerase [Sphingobium sp. TomTYG75]
MTIQRLIAQAVEKPWGRTDIPSHMRINGVGRIGEIWFSPEREMSLPLLVKYIFTSEKLSVQVHPNDKQARQYGLSGGKSECWYVLDAAADAKLGIGTIQNLTRDELREAALDGSIEALIEWKPVMPGSFYYIPAGTVHAIGGGVSLVEVQQNSDVTFRLYDYGRQRELHLEMGIEVSIAEPYAMPNRVIPVTAEEQLVGSGAPFTLDIIQGASHTRRKLEGDILWFIPLAGYGTIDEQPWRSGECWLIEGGATFSIAKEMSALITRPTLMQSGNSRNNSDTNEAIVVGN